MLLALLDILTTRIDNFIRQGYRNWSSKSFMCVLVLILNLAGPGNLSSLAQSAVVTSNDQATLQFPDSLTFSIDLKSDAEINQVVLDYRVEQVTCGEVSAEAFPTFTPGKTVQATWTWEMKQSGSLPPGAKIHWHWQVADSAGNTVTTDEQTVTWLDSKHNWQTLSGENINLHWYSGGDSFGKDLHDAATKALASLDQIIGLKPTKPIDLYIYADTQDMRDAILYEPGWTGGQAFPEYDIVIIGISPDQLEWGKSTEAHELTHVLVGHFTFTCLGFIPNWIVEGIAMVGEGGPDPTSQTAFEKAITDDTLMSVRSLSGGFSEKSDKADISYSESYSLVNFLIEGYGKDKFMNLLISLREGAIADEALKSVYGFDIEGLEDAWRAKIGARPRTPIGSEAATPTVTPTPTIVPTIVPISGDLAAPTLAPTRIRITPTPTVPSTPTPHATVRPPTDIPSPVKETTPSTAPSNISDVIRIISSCGIIGLILLGVLLLFFFTVIKPSRRRRQS
jgi:hypothetical protein